MMDPAAQIPQAQGVESEKKWCVDGKAQQHPPPSLEAVSKVLDDDNLLIEILLRVGFPTTLVHAALVCRRWLHHASKPVFLSSFRKLHPPRLFGFYVYGIANVSLDETRPRFVPMAPQPPELASVVHRLDAYDKEDTSSREYDEWGSDDFMDGFWNGKLSERGIAGGPPSFPYNQLEAGESVFIDLLSKQKGHGVLYEWSPIDANNNEWEEKCTMSMYTLQDGFWHMHTSATPELTYIRVDMEPLLVKSKVYMRRLAEGDILVWDLTASSFFTIQLPEGVEYLHRNTMLSPSDDSEVYLMHLYKVEFRIWLHSGDNWFLMNAICLSPFCAILGMSDAMTKNEYNAIIRIGEVWDKVEYVFLKIGQCALYLDIKRRVVGKVYEVTEENESLCDIHPVMMIWPPAFPSLQDDTARNAM